MSDRRLEQLKLEWRHQSGPRSPNNQIGGLLDLIAYCKPQSVLEIGSHYGVSTEAFLLYCNRVVAVDPWEERQFYAQFLARCSAYPGFAVVRGVSPAALTMFAPRSFDLCYVDGQHDYDSVFADIKACRPLAIRWIAGHDLHMPTVQQAVTDIFGADHPCTVFSDHSWVVPVS